ncbi:MAG: PQQ-like beta-propeller repeat protein [Sandaracinaceae bacterium]|nr:PQQ-like beta-propeller repeat protein [Sandaracinaceae bacterium]
MVWRVDRAGPTVLGWSDGALTADDGGDIVVIDAASGAVRAQVAAPARQSGFDDLPRAMLLGDALVTEPEPRTLAVRSLEGAERWRTPCAGPAFEACRVRAVRAGDALMIATGRSFLELVAFDASTGARRWSYAPDLGVAHERESFATDGALVFVATYAHRLVALDVHDRGAALGGGVRRGVRQRRRDRSRTRAVHAGLGGPRSRDRRRRGRLRAPRLRRRERRASPPPPRTRRRHVRDERRRVGRGGPLRGRRGVCRGRRGAAARSRERRRHLDAHHHGAGAQRDRARRRRLGAWRVRLALAAPCARRRGPRAVGPLGRSSGDRRGRRDRRRRRERRPAPRPGARDRTGSGAGGERHRAARERGRPARRGPPRARGRRGRDHGRVRRVLGARPRAGWRPRVDRGDPPSPCDRYERVFVPLGAGEPLALRRLARECLER